MGPPGDHPATEGDHLVVTSSTCQEAELNGKEEDIELPYGVFEEEVEPLREWQGSLENLVNGFLPSRSGPTRGN